MKNAFNRKPLSFAIVGFGMYAREAIYRTFTHMPKSEFHLRTICDQKLRKPEHDMMLMHKREDETLFQTTVTAPCMTTNYQDVLTDPEVDVVIVATALEQHFEIALAALRAGKHVLCEKPVTPTPEEARRLIDEAQASGVSFAVNNILCFEDSFQGFMRELPNLGAVNTFIHRRNHRVVPHRQSWPALYDHCHPLYLADMVFDYPEHEIPVSRYIQHAPDMATALSQSYGATMDIKGENSVMIMQSNAIAEKIDERRTTNIYCDKGGVVWDERSVDLGQDMRAEKLSIHRKGGTEPEHYSSPILPYRRILENIACQIRGELYLPTAGASLRTMEMIDGLKDFKSDVTLQLTPIPTSERAMLKRYFGHDLRVSHDRTSQIKTRSYS